MRQQYPYSIKGEKNPVNICIYWARVFFLIFCYSETLYLCNNKLKIVLLEQYSFWKIYQKIHVTMMSILYKAERGKCCDSSYLWRERHFSTILCFHRTKCYQWEITRYYCLIIYDGHFWPPNLCSISIQFLIYTLTYLIFMPKSLFFSYMFLFVFQCAGNAHCRVPVGFLWYVGNDSARAQCLDQGEDEGTLVAKQIVQVGA